MEKVFVTFDKKLEDTNKFYSRFDNIPLKTKVISGDTVHYQIFCYIANRKLFSLHIETAKKLRKQSDIINGKNIYYLVPTITKGAGIYGVQTKQHHNKVPVSLLANFVGFGRRRYFHSFRNPNPPSESAIIW